MQLEKTKQKMISIKTLKRLNQTFSRYNLTQKLHAYTIKLLQT